MSFFKLSYSIESSFETIGVSHIVVAEIHDVTPRAEDETLEELKKVGVEAILQQGPNLIRSSEILRSYRELVGSIGRSAKKFAPSAETLLEVVFARQRLPKINTVVDSYNLVAAQTHLAFGVHDIDTLNGPITFKRSDGGEQFVSVGGTNAKSVQPGDYVYCDSARVLAWLDSKDSDAVKITETTENVVIVLQGTPATSIEYRVTAATQACENIVRFCGGSFQIKVI